MRRAWWGFWLMVILTAATVRPEPVEGQTEGVKYNPHFGNAIEKAKSQHAGKRWLECVIRVQHQPTPAEIAQLEAAGFKSRSVIDTIVTGRIQVRHVQQLIDLPLVVSIEGGGFGGKKRTQGLK